MTEVNERTSIDLGIALKALAEPTRFKIAQLLLERHHCSRSISKTLGISESAVSQHMTVLKKAGLVEGFRHGYHVHYVLRPEALQAIVMRFEAWIERTEQIEDCHETNPCRFKLDDGTNGCLYRSE